MVYSNTVLPVWVDLIQDSLKLWVGFTTLHQCKVIPEGAQARFELMVLQLAISIFVKVSVCVGRWGGVKGV